MLFKMCYCKVKNNFVKFIWLFINKFCKYVIKNMDKNKTLVISKFSNGKRKRIRNLLIM